MDESTIDYKALYEQVINENEKLREKITQRFNKDNPINEAIDNTIDNIVFVVKQSDPMKIYIWACIAFLVLMSIISILELFIK